MLLVVSRIGWLDSDGSRSDWFTDAWIGSKWADDCELAITVDSWARMDRVYRHEIVSQFAEHASVDENIADIHPMKLEESMIANL